MHATEAAQHQQNIFIQGFIAAEFVTPFSWHLFCGLLVTYYQTFVNPVLTEIQHCLRFTSFHQTTFRWAQTRESFPICKYCFRSLNCDLDVTHWRTLSSQTLWLTTLRDVHSYTCNTQSHIDRELCISALCSPSLRSTCPEARAHSIVKPFIYIFTAFGWQEILQRSYFVVLSSFQSRINH